MNQSELLEKLKFEFSDMENLANTFEEPVFFKQPHAEKWSVAQNIVHLINSTKGIASALKEPSVLGAYGQANRPSRDFETIQETYNTVLTDLKAKGMPYKHLEAEGSKAQLLYNFNEINEKLVTRAALLSETDFDTLQLPHPVLGMMTLREMLYFTADHTRHHYNIVEKINS
jgi:DinB superfamily